MQPCAEVHPPCHAQLERFACVYTSHVSNLVGGGFHPVRTAPTALRGLIGCYCPLYLHEEHIRFMLAGVL